MRRFIIVAASALLLLPLLSDSADAQRGGGGGFGGGGFRGGGGFSGAGSLAAASVGRQLAAEAFAPLELAGDDGLVAVWQVALMGGARSSRTGRWVGWKAGLGR
jgi:hypothetical protein